MPTVACPDCSHPLSGENRCPACALPLVGPLAQRLWQLDVELDRLGQERTWLIAQLRTTTATVTAPRPSAAPVEVSHRSAQNALLSLGVLLLGVAGLVLAAVTYDRLGAGGRAGALLALTGLVGWAARPLLARGLTASAETTSTVALLLCALDAAGLRSLGLGTDLSTTAYAAAAAALLALVALAYATAVPVLAARLGALLLVHGAPLLALAAAADGPGPWAGALVALVAVDLLLVGHGVLVRATGVAAGLTAVAALLTAGPAAHDGDPAAQLSLLALAAVAAAAAVTRPALAVLPSPLVALAAWTAVGTGLSPAGQGLLVAGTGLAGALLAALLPHVLRAPALLGALTTAGLAAADQAGHALAFLALPLGWLDAPWSLTAASSRLALSPDEAWTGSLLGLAALALAAAVLAVAELRGPAIALAALSAALLPVGLDVPYAVALAVGLALTAALVAAGALRAPAALPAALVAGLHVLVWSAADRQATLVVVGLLALLCAAGATRLDGPVLPGLAGALVTLEVGALGAAGGLAVPQVGGLLLVAVVALTGCAALLGGRRAPGAEAAAVLAAGAGLMLAAADPGWSSWVLAGLGLAALGTALRPDRRPAAVVGALLLAASSWVRLVEAGVEAPEPYVVPLALAALGLGHLRRGAAPATRSFAAYGSGLSLLLVPSLLAVGSGGLQRPLVLGLVALGVTVVGARTRLQAPLVLGGAVLALDALHLLAPYAADLPRWLPLAVVGAALVGLGATYEQRGRDLVRLRERYDAMA